MKKISLSVKEFNTLNQLHDYSFKQRGNPDIYSRVVAMKGDAPKANIGLSWKDKGKSFIYVESNKNPKKTKALRRHELTHYIRNKKKKTTAKWSQQSSHGLKKGIGTLVEEIAATRKGSIKKSPINKQISNKILYPIESGMGATIGKKIRFNKLRKLIKLGEFAPGIPSKKKVTDLPNVSSPQKWEFVIQKHLADKAGPHFDLRIGPPGGPGFSWVIHRIPEIGEKTMAIRQPDHSIKYFEFEGKIKEGYGKGTVQTFQRGNVEVISSSPNKITFHYYKTGSDFQKLSLVNTGQGWLLVNHTMPKTVAKHLETSPLKYKDQSLTYKAQEGDVSIPKIDGASSTTILRAGKTPLVFSKRISKKTNRPIEYTPKIPRIMNTRSPKELGTTVLRTEVYGITEDGKEISNNLLGAILNSGVEKSRATQESLKVPLRLAAYDVIKYKGKNYTNKSIQEKLKAIREISDMYPVIGDPIQIGKKIHFPEGDVIWRNNIPIKVKKKQESDVYVRRIFPEEKGRRAGGIEYSLTPTGPIIGRVGTGWKHKELTQMLKNPEEFIGRVARVYSQGKFPSHALRSPSFNTWHLDKNAVFNTSSQLKVLKNIKNLIVKKDTLKPIKRKHTFSAITPSGYNRYNIFAKGTLARMLGVKKLSPQIKGKIIVPEKGDAVKALTGGLKSKGVKLPYVQKQDRIAIDAIVKTHEKNELLAKIHPKFRSHSSHNAPEVLLKEHNSVLGLPRNQSKAKTYMKRMRTKADPAITLMEESIPGFKYGKSPRYSRHAIKRLNTIVEKNASYFIAADVPTSVEPQISHKINPDSLHITLSYLGKKSPEEIKKIKRFLARKSKKNWKGTTLESKGYGRFDPRRKNIAIRTIKPNSRLSKMVKDLNKSSITETKTFWRNNYKPHITVGRGKQVPKLFNKKTVDIPVKSIGLYKVRKPGNYELIKNYDLRKRNLLDKTIDFFKGD